MRFRIGAPETDEAFDPEAEGWRSMWEPSPILINVLALPVAVGLGALVILGWGPFGTSGPVKLTIGGPVLLIGFPLLAFAHELVHAFAYPGWGTAVRVVIGIWPSRLLCYAMTCDAVSRNRMLLVYLAPLLILSVLPVLVHRLIAPQHFGVLAIAVTNAFCSGGDAFLAPLIALQVPSGAILKNKGWRTYWKMPEGDGAPSG